MYAHILKKLSCFHYNIGFFKFNNNFFENKIDIIWLKHSYRDRFFADPFILGIKDNNLMVLVEEFLYSIWKGRISLLIIDKNTYELKSTKPILDLDTHLSFPFIFREDDKTYILPENSMSGKCKLYEWNGEQEKLSYVKDLIDLPLVDPVLIHHEDNYILLGSLLGNNENCDLYIWSSSQLLGDYKPDNGILIKSDISCGRRGGNFFYLNGNLYAATQSCTRNYGEALVICKVDTINKTTLQETKQSIINPDPLYPFGLHTFNVYKDLGVVDGLDYIFSPITKIKATIKKYIHYR